MLVHCCNGLHNIHYTVDQMLIALVLTNERFILEYSSRWPGTLVQQARIESKHYYCKWNGIQHTLYVFLKLQGHTVA